jgi:hypothetical protein
LLVNFKLYGASGGMSSSCARCGASHAAGAAACASCGQPRVAAAGTGDFQYGMLDLGSGPDLKAAPALDLGLPNPREQAAASRWGAATSLELPQPKAPAARPVSAPLAIEAAAPAALADSTLSELEGLDFSAPVRDRASATGANAASSAQRRSAETLLAGTQPAPGTSAPDTAMPYGRGALLDDNPFNVAFGSGAAAQPALELVNVNEPIVPAQPAAPPAPRESGPQKRARTIREIAQYGAPPEKLYGAPAYWVRIVLRKRVLMEQLAALSAQRKRADDAANEALAKLGEALYALREDAQLADLSRQIAAVKDAEARAGEVEAESQKRKQELQRTLAKLDRDLGRREKHVAPLRIKESELTAKIDELKARARKLDAQRKKLETELEAVRAKGGNPERFGALQTERDARHGELQNLGIEMRPLEDDLAALQRDIAKHTRAIGALQEQRQAANTQLQRAEQTHRVSFGTAKGVRLQALLSLANAGIKIGLGELVPDCEKAADDAAEQAEEKRALEEIHRAAVDSYDHKAFSQGLTILLGGSVALFLLLAVLVVM